MNTLIVLGASLIAVLGLALAAKLLGLGVEPRIADREEALRLARELHFDAVDARLEGNGAIVTDACGNRARLRRHGNHFVVADA